MEQTLQSKTKCKKTLKVIGIILGIAILALIIAIAGLVITLKVRYGDYDDEWIRTGTYDAIQERYGKFDQVVYFYNGDRDKMVVKWKGEYIEDYKALYGDDAYDPEHQVLFSAGYDQTNRWMGSLYIYNIYFDESGKALKTHYMHTSDAREKNFIP